MTTKAVTVTLALILMAGFAPAQKVKSQKESEAFQAIQKEQNLDARMKKADEFVAKFADSELKSMALQIAAVAADQKGDSGKEIVYGQSALEADPKNFEVMLLISGELAQHTRDNDLDKEEKLTRAEKLANDAINGTKAAPKPAGAVTDAQWADYQKDLTAQGHRDLGMIATVRKKLDVAVAEFKAATDTDNPDPVTMVRLTDAYLQTGKNDEALAEATKVLAIPNLNATVKQFAENQKQRAQQAKSGKK
jgi:hypothetical protein